MTCRRTVPWGGPNDGDGDGVMLVSCRLLVAGGACAIGICAKLPCMTDGGIGVVTMDAGIITDPKDGFGVMAIGIV
jgi:hypothetical protein